MYTYKYIHIPTYTYIYIHIHTYTYIYHIYTFKYIYIHTYTYVYIHIPTGAWRKLTDDGVRAHVLANNCRIAAQKNRKRRNIGSCIPLSNFVHLPSVDCTILALLSCRVNLLKLEILLAPKPGRAKQFLDCVVDGPEKEDYALCPISRLGKVPMHDASWNVELDGLFPHCFHLGVADSVRLELGICCPLQHPVSVCVTTVRSRRGVMCQHLKLGTVEM